jgi:hypothetical protein
MSIDTSFALTATGYDRRRRAEHVIRAPAPDADAPALPRGTPLERVVAAYCQQRHAAGQRMPQLAALQTAATRAGHARMRTPAALRTLSALRDSWVASQKGTTA